MHEPARSFRVIRFGLFEADLAARQLRKNGQNVKLQDRPFDILSILLERPGEMVAREEFRRRLWSSDTFVDFDHSLNASINKLRQALDDVADNPRFVATVGRKGYRFIAPVERAGPVLATPLVSHELKGEEKSAGLPAGRRFPRPGIQWWLAVVGVAVVVAILAMFLRPSPVPRVLRTLQLTHEGDITYELVTDGLRLYFRKGLNYGGKLNQISIRGGDIFPVAEAIPGASLADIAPETSELLVIDDMHALWTVSLLGNRARRVGEDKVNSAAWSPDGRRVVYASGLDLYVVNRDGAGRQKLVTLSAAASCLRWSPDGTKLRFGLDDPRPQPDNLWEVGSDGRNLRPLLSNWRAGTRPTCGSWTPDGRYFFFEAVRDGVRDIWVMQEKPGMFGRAVEPVQLTSGPLNFFSPLSSRDGRSIFVVGQQRRGELTRYDDRSKQFVPFLNGLSADCVRFSHDGKWVAYTTYPERTLWKSRLDGSERIQLTTAPMRALLPAWSPDDKTILFHAVEKANRPFKIYLISSSGGSPKMLIPDEDSQESGGTWSPDGKAVIYSYNKISVYPSEGSIDLRILDLETKRITVVPESEGLYGPQWSPNGRFVAALVGKEGRHDYLTLYDTATKKWRILLALGVGYPSWSADSQYIYCNTLWRNDPSLIRLAVANGKFESVPVRFRAGGTNGAWSGATPDGSFLLLRELGSQDIYSLDVELP